jgi:uncharacterized SAM-binding protein YcdF (DUF218 family)
MFFVLSKLLNGFAYPTPLCFFMLCIILGCYKRWWARQALGIVVVVFYLASMPLTAGILMHWLEVPRPAPGTLKPRYDVVIVLSGMVHLVRSTADEIEFSDSVERILTGIKLVKRGLAEKLLITGGTGDPLYQDLSEAVRLKSFAMELGVRDEQLLVEGTSRNTYENALHSAHIIREGRYQDLLLVTSAAHMRRSAAVFRKQGLWPDLYPVDYQTAQVPYLKRMTPWTFLPSAHALVTTTAVMHELIGLAMYRLRGYI